MTDTAQARERILDRPWIRFAVKRGARFLVSLWVVITAAFLMIHLIPGDPIRAALGVTALQELVDARRDQLGLNDPLWLQYLNYLQNLFSGEFGTSFISGIPVVDIIGQRLPATLEIALLAFVFAIAIAVPLGVVMAVATRNGARRRLELGFTSTSSIVAAIPDFLMAIGIVAIFGVMLGWLPVAGRSGPASYIAPVLALSIGATSILARILRVEMLAVLKTDYVRTARAKRLSQAWIYLRHALPNAVTTTLTLSGLMLGAMVAGTVLVENAVAWPGLGSSVVSSILSKDYPVVQGIVLMYGIGVLVINLIVDIILAALDPRSAVLES